MTRIDEMSLEEIEKLLTPAKRERKIKYDVAFNRPNNFIPQEISFDEIDSYDFSKGFTEFLISEDYVHLYFDFDSIKTEDEFLGVWSWLDSLKKVFGSYSYGGYCDNEEMESYGFRRFDEGNHYLSMHAVFYETCISTFDLQAIMKHTEKKGFSTKGIHRLCDPNVYKLVSKKQGQKSRQCFRHVLSDKIYKIGDERNKMNHGTICEKLPPSSQIIQIRGSEPIIGKIEWSSLFELKNDIDSSSSVVEESKIESSDLNVEDELIMLSDNELLELLNNFESTYENFTSVVCNILSSPYTSEKLTDLIEKWYFRIRHENVNTIQTYINTYYNQTFSNKWFFSIIKHLNPDEKQKWLNTYAQKSIDLSINIDLNEPFNLSSLRTKDYRLKGGIGINVNGFINDLKRCVAVINSAEMVFVVKDYDGVKDTSKLSFLTDKGFERLMKSINLGYYFKDGKKKQVNAYTVYCEGTNKNYLMKKGMRFYDEREDIFSYFNGYDYKLLPEVENNKIAKFLNHIKEVIAKNNEELYEYIINWYSYILQNPAGKTGIVLVITGKQGTGKNAFTNVLCDLMKRYSNRNITKIDSIVGKFNASIENMKLIVCNELSSVETNKYLNHDALKSVITEKEAVINQKNMPERSIENVANLIMVSNNFNVAKVESGDRRYVVTEVSDKYKGDSEYFDSLWQSFDNDFYNNLFTFFMNRDVSKFNPSKIPMTQEREDLIEASKSSYQLFYEEYEEAFNDDEGWACTSCYQAYVRYCKENNYCVCAANTFGAKMHDFVEKKRIRHDGERSFFYFARGKH